MPRPPSQCAADGEQRPASKPSKSDKFRERTLAADKMRLQIIAASESGGTTREDGQTNQSHGDHEIRYGEPS